MIRSMRLLKVSGIEVYLDWSLLIVFALVTVSLGGSVFPQWHPDWTAALSWTTAAVAAVLLIASVLLHELSHALVGRWQGVEIKRITLFVFGGMAHLEQEPRAWRAELLMAVVGPLVSLVIGVGCVLVGSTGIAQDTLTMDAAAAAMRDLGPAFTLLLWLGPINIVLAVFNLIPAFPLDGGRALRAILWGATGDLDRATRWAAAGGQAFSWVLIAAGVGMALGLRVPWFGTGLGGGLWVALIGWFLHNAAIMSYRQLQLRESLAGVPVARLMKTHFATVSADLSVQTLVDDYVMTNEQRCFPVVEQRRLGGVVCLEDVRKVHRDAWPTTRIAEIMTPADRLATMPPDGPAIDALSTLTRRRVAQLPIVDHGELQGLVSREDVLKWLSIHGHGSGGTHDGGGERLDAAGT